MRMHQTAQFQNTWNRLSDLTEEIHKPFVSLVGLKYFWEKFQVCNLIFSDVKIS